MRFMFIVKSAHRGWLCREQRSSAGATASDYDSGVSPLVGVLLPELCSAAKRRSVPFAVIGFDPAASPAIGAP